MVFTDFTNNVLDSIHGKDDSDIKKQAYDVIELIVNEVLDTMEDERIKKMNQTLERKGYNESEIKAVVLSSIMNLVMKEFKDKKDYIERLLPCILSQLGIYKEEG